MEEKNATIKDVTAQGLKGQGTKGTTDLQRNTAAGF